MSVAAEWTAKYPLSLFSKTGSINGPGDSLTVPGMISGAPCEITVDTGSNISIVRPDLLNPVPKKTVTLLAT